MNCYLTGRVGADDSGVHAIKSIFVLTTDYSGIIAAATAPKSGDPAI
jgi:hypothetical protein